MKGGRSGKGTAEARTESAGYAAVLTGDGSVTFRNPFFNETYHSASGAVEESMKKFVEPSNIPDIIKTADRISILDVCFGLGYNSCAAIDFIRNHNEDISIDIVGLENDPFLKNIVGLIYPHLKHYHLIRELFASKDCMIRKDNISIRIVWGDALKTIKSVRGIFDTCFLDPFSPKVCPHLWSKEFLSDISGMMKKGGVLTTYSCAGSVRKNLVSAGFKVRDGPCIGRRAPSTIAVKL
ncbi:hypothetical protein JW968_06755 [Candidatus Woesearchaeota archaeon]|nr:hypothetical protein [Candidatus Woesearchaeota archaeon]